MSNGSSLPSRTRRRNQTRGKWVVVALLLVALIGALLVRNAWKTPLANNAPVVKEGGTDIVSSGGQSAETQPNAIAMVTENTPTAQPPSPDDIPVTIQEPLVENAIIGYDADGNELLTVSGTGDARCTAIRFLLDGTLIGVTIPDTDGNWALTVNQLPTVGNHMSELECEAENGIYTAAPRAFELPQPPIVEPTAVIEEPVIESPTAENNEDENSAETPAADPDPATNPDDNQTESTDPTPEPETPDPAIKQPTVSIAQDLTKYIGGPILLRGEAKADEIIELIFDNGETQIVDTTRANAEGKWHYRGMLTEPGVYA
ncbi:MAG TPA: hypothetical protein ENJ56_01455, partial [Anaerolineae bacterium]|nr:hypothetical protein [Anaerolineae bacterium]